MAKSHHPADPKWIEAGSSIRRTPSESFLTRDGVPAVLSHPHLDWLQDDVIILSSLLFQTQEFDHRFQSHHRSPTEIQDGPPGNQRRQN